MCTFLFTAWRKKSSHIAVCQIGPQWGYGITFDSEIKAKWSNVYPLNVYGELWPIFHYITTKAHGKLYVKEKF
ncbi:hypothetical protein DVA81_19505, partial [Acinetobacter baumannii]